MTETEKNLKFKIEKIEKRLEELERRVNELKWLWDVKEIEDRGKERIQTIYIEK